MARMPTALLMTSLGFTMFKGVQNAVDEEAPGEGCVGAPAQPW